MCRDMICAQCGEPVDLAGLLGYVHPDGSIYGPDGHAVVPVHSYCDNSLCILPPGQEHDFCVVK
jgi:hypothetical protein